MSGEKHYTEVGKRLFTQILKKYAHVIERKESDTTSLRMKEEAWNQICDEYNASTVISMKRNVQQLKKYWSNLKSIQRDALTKEKQSHLATGGGPETPLVEIDPDIALILPHLMTTAPVIFSSDIKTDIMEVRRQDAYEGKFITEDFLLNDNADFGGFPGASTSTEPRSHSDETLVYKDEVLEMTAATAAAPTSDSKKRCLLNGDDVVPVPRKSEEFKNSSELRNTL